VSNVTSGDGTTIDYDRYGDGPTVVMVGGATQYRGMDERGTSRAWTTSTRSTRTPGTRRTC
jgi:hypothetical protein